MGTRKGRGFDRLFDDWDLALVDPPGAALAALTRVPPHAARSIPLPAATSPATTRTAPSERRTTTGSRFLGNQGRHRGAVCKPHTTRTRRSQTRPAREARNAIST